MGSFGEISEATTTLTTSYNSYNSYNSFNNQRQQLQQLNKMDAFVGTWKARQPANEEEKAQFIAFCIAEADGALPDEFHDNLLKSEMGCTITKVGGNKYEMNHFAKGIYETKNTFEVGKPSTLPDPTTGKTFTMTLTVKDGMFITDTTNDKNSMKGVHKCWLKNGGKAMYSENTLKREGKDDITMKQWSDRS